MEKTTTLNHIRTYPNGTIEGHYDLVVSHEGVVLKKSRHIGVFSGVDIEAHIEAVNRSLVEDLDMPAITDSDAALLRKAVS